MRTDKQIRTLKRWVEALRSGKYKRTYGHLIRSPGDPSGASYCCLGVLCDLVNPSGWDGTRHQGSDLMPSQDILDRVGLGGSNASVLAKKNDVGASFHEIADYIESRYKL